MRPTSLHPWDPGALLRRRDALRVLAACLAEWCLPRRIFAQREPTKPDRRVIVVTAAKTASKATLAKTCFISPEQGFRRCLGSRPKARAPNQALPNFCRSLNLP